MTTAEVRVSAEQGWSSPVVGIMGGLGPLAGATFLRVLTLLTPAASDQEQLDAVLLSHSTTPDRTARIKDPEAPDPAPVLLADAQRLEALGAEVIAVPCNSAHPFLRGMTDRVGVPMIDIVEVTARAAVEQVHAAGVGEAPRIGVLATDGTKAAGLYRDALSRLGAEPVDTTDDEQREVMRIIYEQVKAGKPTDLSLLQDLTTALTERGCAAVVLGCTELSVAYDEHQLHRDSRLVDSVESLARETLRRVGRSTAR